MNVPVAHFLPFVVAAGVLAWWRPHVALLLPLAFHASYLLRSQVGLGALQLPITLLEVLLWIAVVSAVGHAWVDARVRGAYQDAWRALPRRALLCVVLFVAAVTVSAVIAPHPRTAWGQWKAFIVEPIVYAALLLPMLRSPGGQRRVAVAILLGGTVSAGLSLAVGTRTADFGRLRGIYDVPNSLALVLAPLTVFAAAVAATPRRVQGRLVHLARWSLLLFVPTLLLAQSFGGMGAASVGFSLAAVTHLRSVSRHTLRKCVVGVAALVLIGVVFLWVSGRLAHAVGSNSPLVARLQIWQVSLALVRDHPILGTGLGTFEPAYQQKLHELLVNGSRQQAVGSGDGRRGYCLLPTASCPPLEWLVRDPHNILLSFWLNTGLLGLLSMGGLVALALRGSRRRSFAPSSRAQDDEEQRSLVASRAALIALLVFGLVDVPYLKNDLSLLWWILLVFNMKSPTS